MADDQGDQGGRGDRRIGRGGAEAEAEEHAQAVPGRRVRFGFARLLPDTDRPRAWLLTVDGAPQSYVDLDDPGYLEFEYARCIGHAVDTAAPPGAPLDVLHLGGGAFTLPRYVAATRPGSRQEVVEADGELARFVEEHLPLPMGAGIRVRIADAGEALADFPSAAADLVLVDVFDGSTVPPTVTAVGFVRHAARVLRPGGLYAANLADGPPLEFIRAQVATAGAVFPHVCLLAEAAVLAGRRFGNLVLLASARELPVDALVRRLAGDPFPAKVRYGPALERFTAGAEPVADEQARASPAPPSGSFGIG